MSVEVLREELAFFEEQKAALLKTHPGQYALIKGRQLIGIYPLEADAYTEGYRRFVGQPFLVKQILEKEPTEQVPLLAYQIRRAAL